MRVGESDMWVGGEQPELPADELGSVPIADLISDGVEIFSPPPATDAPTFVATDLPTGVADALPLISSSPLSGLLAPGGAASTILGSLGAALGSGGCSLYQNPFSSIANAAKFLFDGASGGSFPLAQSTIDACKSVVDEVGDFSQGVDLDCWYTLGEFLGSLNDLDFTGLDEETERYIQDLRDDAALQLIVGGLVGTHGMLQSQASLDLIRILGREQSENERLIETERKVDREHTERIVVAEDGDGNARTVSRSIEENGFDLDERERRRHLDP
jgi:hypothetical protein